VYASDAMKRLVDRIGAAAASDASVLISGESGVGKELVARALHDLSPRWDQPFVALNCSAIPGDLMESELFGHAKGAFTGAVKTVDGRFRQADGGTLFLDEVGELPLSLQPKLLRVLETRTFEPVGEARTVASDFRLVSASNRDLLEEADQGRFRDDLYYRIGIVPLHVPPLRERLDDVPVLWEHFSELHAGRILQTSDAALERLQAMPWRGNVRELKNVNQRAVLVAAGDVLDEAALDEALAMDRRPVSSRGHSGELGFDAVGTLAGPLPEGGLSLVDLEKQVVSMALERFNGNKSKAAVYLDVPRHVLIYRIQKYGLES
jgi:two-component system NtrC family response regulator